MALAPDSEIGIKLKELLVNEIQRRYERSQEDAGDISEYLIYLISASKNHEEIVKEVKDIADIPIDTGFVQEVFVEIEKLQNPPQQHQQEEPLQQQQPQSIETDQVVPHQVSINVPTGPKRALTEDEKRAIRQQRFGGAPINKSGNGGISKKGPTKPLNQKKFQKAFENSPGNINFTNKLPSHIPKGRCVEFPNCQNKACEFAHPTKPCFAYPNCPNPPGTCNYLHPDQDQELMEKLDQKKKEYEAKKINNILVSQGSCKFGLKCAKETCPFAHPTPVNEDAKIQTLEWCAQGKTCQDPSCTKSHPPPPSAKQENSASSIDIALEQCKFGSQCTNYKCPRRHALSNVPCRAGAECRRVDCTFAHPIQEQCRFGINCKNKNCLYQHPEGRTVVVTNTWSKEEPNPDSSNSIGATQERSFAVPEDQVMEQAVQQ